MKNTDAEYTSIRYTTESEPTILKTIGQIILLIPLGILNAWVVKTLYDWFLLPLHAPEINLWHAWGLSLIARFLISRHSEDDRSYSERFIYAIVNCLVALLIGFILKGLI